MLDLITKTFLCAFCENVITITMYITNPGTMQYLYIHTGEQTAVFVIADDKISTMFLSRHQYFSFFLNYLQPNASVFDA